MRNATAPLLIAIVLAHAAARAASAQACVGGPVDPGRWSVAATYGVQPRSVFANEHTFGGDVAWNLPGPLAVQATYGHTRLLDGNWSQQTVSVRPTLELRHRAASLCLVAGAEYWRRPGYPVTTAYTTPDTALYDIPASLSLSGWRIPMGVGAALTHTVAPGTRASAYVLPHVILNRYRQHLQASTVGVEDVHDLSKDGPGIEAGLRLRHRSLMGGLTYLHTTWHELSTVWTFTIGIER